MKKINFLIIWFYFDQKIPGKIKFYFDMYFQLFVLMLFLKNNKGRPIPKAYPISVYKIKIIYSNKLIQNEENTHHLIQYTDNNGNIVMPVSTIEDLKFLEFYLGFMNIPHKSLHIYMESYKSYSLIQAIKKYFDIRKAISSYTSKITTNELLFLASVGAEI